MSAGHSLFFQLTYSPDLNQVENFIAENKEKLQCVVSKNDIPFGQTQNPNLWDYADGVDIIVSGGISKGYPTAWYDPHSHVYAFQNYGGGTSFGHFILKYDLCKFYSILAYPPLDYYHVISH